MAKKIQQIDLDELAEMPDEEIRLYLLSSGLSAKEIHLERHFIWFRRFYGFAGFKEARQAVYNNDATEGALQLMQTMIEMVGSDNKLRSQLTTLEIQKSISSQSSNAANTRWSKPGTQAEKKTQLDSALADVEIMLREGKRPTWRHHDFTTAMRNKYPLLAPRPDQQQPPRDKLRTGIIKLCEKYGREVTGR